MEKLLLFPELVIVDDAEGSILKIILEEINNKKKEIELLLSGKTWQDNIHSTFDRCKNILDVLNLVNLKNFITEKTLYYVNSIDYFKGKYDILLWDSWINVSNKFGFQNIHTHTVNEFLISGVFYIDTNGKDGNLVFCPGFIDFFKKEHIITPKIGQIVIFSGNLPHKVEFNQGESARVSLSFNFKLIEKKL